MSTSTALLSARRAALGSAIVALLVVATASPAFAWQPTRSHATLVAQEAASPAIASGPQSTQAASAPIDSTAEALAAGGRRAPGGKAHTVVRYGIDVSHWQGRIDWDRVARSGIRFAIAKATEGTWMVDPMYRRNRTLAERNGLYFTAYHYANPSRKPGDAKREADWFLRHARLRGPNLLPALDLEEHGGLSPAELERWTFAWMRRVERKLGVKPMIYTSPGFWSGWVGDTPDLARAGFEMLWVSHWQTRKPWVPGNRWAGEGWTFWQWTERGRIAGIDGYVDRNVYSGPQLQRLTIKEIRRDGPPDGDGKRRPRPR